MVAIVVLFLVWLAKILVPFLAWLAEIFFGPNACQIVKSHLSPFVCCGKCGTSYS